MKKHLVPVGRLFATAGAAALGVVAFAGQAAASATSQQVAAQTGLTTGRIGPTVVAFLALGGVIVGGLAMAGRVGPAWAQSAVAIGVVSIIGGVAFLAVADGGPGTGNGVVASAAAIVLGLAATALGRLSRSRTHRA